MHPPIGEGVSTDFKSSNRIKISRLIQILLYFYWFGAPTPQGGGWSGCLRGWKWCGDLLDDVQMMGMTWGPRGWHGDHGDNMWRPRRPRGQHVETMETTDHGDHMGTFWGLWGQCGDERDNMGMTGMTGMTWGPWGQHGDHGDKEITKNAITFERIEIIEFHLKIWHPWTLPHTCRLQLMCRWGGVLSQMAEVV